MCVGRGQIVMRLVFWYVFVYRGSYLDDGVFLSVLVIRIISLYGAMHL